MTREEFEATLKRLCRQEPFRPFVFELTDGRRIEVFDTEALGFNGGTATCGTKDELHDIDCEQVTRIVELDQREVRAVTREEWEAELRRLIWQEPFRPFVIELKSGRTAEVVAPERVGFGGGNGSVILPGDRPVLFKLSDVERIIEAVSPGMSHAS